MRISLSALGRREDEEMRAYIAKRSVIVPIPFDIHIIPLFMPMNLNKQVLEVGSEVTYRTQLRLFMRDKESVERLVSLRFNPKIASQSVFSIEESRGEESHRLVGERLPVVAECHEAEQISIDILSLSKHSRLQERELERS